MCHYSCETCSNGGDTDCITCILGRNLDLGKCVCQSGMYEMNNTCFICDSNCL